MPSCFIDIITLSPAARNSAIAVCCAGSVISTTPPHCCRSLCQPKPRSAINSPSCRSRCRFSAGSSRRIRPPAAPRGRRARQLAMIGLNISISRPSASMVRSTSSTAIGPSSHQMLGGIHRLVEAAEMADAQHLVADQRPQFQFDRGGEGQRAFGADQEMRQIVGRDCAAPAHRDCSRRPGAAPSGTFRDLGGLRAPAPADRKRARRATLASGESGATSPKCSRVPSASAASIDSVLSRMVP